MATNVIELLGLETSTQKGPLRDYAFVMLFFSIHSLQTKRILSEAAIICLFPQRPSIVFSDSISLLSVTIHPGHTLCLSMNLLFCPLAFLEAGLLDTYEHTYTRNSDSSRLSKVFPFVSLPLLSHSETNVSKTTLTQKPRIVHL